MVDVAFEGNASKLAQKWSGQGLARTHAAQEKSLCTVECVQSLLAAGNPGAMGPADLNYYWEVGPKHTLAQFGKFKNWQQQDSGFWVVQRPITARPQEQALLEPPAECLPVDKLPKCA